MVCQIETGQAELAQQQLKSSAILLLQPINQDVQVSLIKTTFSFSVFSIRPTIIYICMCKALKITASHYPRRVCPIILF